VPFLIAPSTPVASVRDHLRLLGCRPVHEERVMRVWAQALGWNERGRQACDFLPRRLREALPTLDRDLRSLARLRSMHPAADGSARLLVELLDGRAIESVLLPGGGLCVSSQVGCAVGCVFCATGQGGLERQLGSAEIVAQVALARTLQPVKKVVFMGMGEPAHNLDEVLAAIELLGTAGGIGHKNLVFSTVGDARVFERLPHGCVRPALALSLHSTDAAVRARLLPRAPRIDPADLVEAGERYARLTGYPIQYQWTLLAGINDSEEVEGIASLLVGKFAVMNFIAWNAVEGVTFERPTPQRSAAILHTLRKRGIVATLRQSAGQDVDAGCGQLRARGAGAAERGHAHQRIAIVPATSRSARCSPAAT